MPDARRTTLEIRPADIPRGPPLALRVSVPNRAEVGKPISAESAFSCHTREASPAVDMQHFLERTPAQRTEPAFRPAEQFQDLHWQNEFDGIWICASLRHVP